jgi:hypothetical protein
MNDRTKYIAIPTRFFHLLDTKLPKSMDLLIQLIFHLVDIFSELRTALESGWVDYFRYEVG